MVSGTVIERKTFRLVAVFLALCLGLLGVAVMQVHARAQTLGQTWYLAEGSNNWGFYTEIHLANPNNTNVQTLFTYMLPSGQTVTQNVWLAPQSQTGVIPYGLLGAVDFSTKIQVVDDVDNIAVDRLMSWYKPGDSPPTIEETSSIGANSPLRNWYLAEGSTNWGFETYILVQNPNGFATDATLMFMIEGESARGFVKRIPAQSRQTFKMSDLVGRKDASCQVTADDPVVVERSMFRGANRAMGHETIAATTPATSYYLAEGTTNWGFTTYVLVQNPNPVPANVSLALQTQHGPMNGPTAVMPPNSRKTFNLNNWINKGQLSRGLDVSTVVNSDQPIIAERAMYWYDKTGKEGGHDTIGMTAGHSSFYFPSGYCGLSQPDGHETWTLVQNSNDVAVDVRLTYLPMDQMKSPIEMDATIPANTRKTFSMIQAAGTGPYSTVVQSLDAGMKVMAETSMYAGAVASFRTTQDFTISRSAGGCSIGAYSDNQ